MKKYFLILFMGFIIQGCLDLRSCDLDKLEGRYYCYNNENAINWLDIYQDGTFEHYYKERDTKLSHSGTWEKSKKNNCIIELDGWKSFNEHGASYEEYGNESLSVSSNWDMPNYYLAIGIEGYSIGFERSKEDMSVNPLKITE
jgi:hypothetical protein